MFHTEAKKSVLHFDLLNVQQQPNSWDCGLFAVAFATELVHGRSPACRHFDVKLLRPHLLDCLKEELCRVFRPSREGWDLEELSSDLQWKQSTVYAEWLMIHYVP